MGWLTWKVPYVIRIPHSVGGIFRSLGLPAPTVLPLYCTSGNQDPPSPYNLHFPEINALLHISSIFGHPLYGNLCSIPLRLFC